MNWPASVMPRKDSKVPGIAKMLAPVFLILLFLLVVYIRSKPSFRAGTLSVSSPRPQPAIAGVLRIFESKQIVGLADLHGCRQELDFLTQLVTSREFFSKINVVTWELGNSRFQEVMDDYILNGKEISRTQLNKCWRENTQPNLLADTPQLVEILTHIRQVNLALPRDKRLRVLLIDAPVEWAHVKDQKDVTREFFDRDSHMAQIIDAEVYAKQLKALFFAGHAHLVREKPGALVGSAPQSKTALDRLESLHPGTTASIWVHVAKMGDNTSALDELGTWPKPSLAEIHGTWYEKLKQPSLMKRRPPSFIAASAQGAVLPPPTNNLLGPPPKENNDLGTWDAVLFLGLRDELRRTAGIAATEIDTQTVNELQRRRRLIGLPDFDLFQPASEEPYFRSEILH